MNAITITVINPGKHSEKKFVFLRKYLFVSNPGISDFLSTDPKLCKNKIMLCNFGMKE